jgi:hypothetical protein
LLAGMAAAVWASEALHIYLNPTCRDCTELEINENAKGMFRIYWHDFIVPFFKAFALLSLIRLPLLPLIKRKRKIDARSNEI